MRRLLLGLSALFFCALGGILWAQDIEVFLAKTLLRAGMVLGAVWLALPQIADSVRRIPPPLLFAGALGSLVIIIRPKSALFVVPILLALIALHFVGWVFKPTPRKKR